jgi:hypothetical protein
MTKHPDTTVRDDGVVKAGGALSYLDNGDGTVTDLNTGLMWEKKSQDGSLHNVDRIFAWSSPLTDTVWDWVADVNAEGGVGFAGYSDWRIPNVKELQSIIDYGRSLQSVDPAFNNHVSDGCSVLHCSATASSLYWSATSVAADPVFLAWSVDFANGFVFFFNKSNTFPVRAVRGGCLP